MGMPRINFAGLNAEELSLAIGIVNSRTGELRASKPPIKYQIVERNGRKYRIPDEHDGKVAYLWRMVAFSVSTKPQHHCMPVMAFCDLPYTGDECRKVEKELNALADKIIKNIPVREWHGVKRWASVL